MKSMYLRSMRQRLGYKPFDSASTRCCKFWHKPYVVGWSVDGEISFGVEDRGSFLIDLIVETKETEVGTFFFRLGYGILFR